MQQSSELVTRLADYHHCTIEVGLFGDVDPKTCENSVFLIAMFGADIDNKFVAALKRNGKMVYHGHLMDSKDEAIEQLLTKYIHRTMSYESCCDFVSPKELEEFSKQMIVCSSKEELAVKLAVRGY